MKKHGWIRLILMTVAFAVCGIATAERYIPTPDEVEAYKENIVRNTAERAAQTQSAGSTSRVDSYAKMLTLSGSFPTMGLGSEDSVKVSDTVNLLRSRLPILQSTMFKAMCATVKDVSDVRTIDPDVVATVIETQTLAIENWVAKQYDQLLTRVSPEAFTKIETHMSGIDFSTRNLDIRASFAAAGSPTVPLFALQEKCNRENEPAIGVTKTESVTGVTK